MPLKKSLVEKDQKVVSDQQLEAILNSIKSVRYGSVTLIIQDGKLVQIDKSEKTRLI